MLLTIVCNIKQLLLVTKRLRNLTLNKKEVHPLAVGSE